jgi:hypothetical protein
MHDAASPSLRARVPAWSQEHPARSASVLVGLCVLLTLALRVPFLTWPLMPDEAGLLIIAQNWSGDGPYVYGDYLVGRGLVVVLFYVLADLLGGAIGIRLLACVVAAATVAAAGWAGYGLRGRAGAGWAALAAAAYSSTYAFSSQVMNERLLAATLVMAGCGATLAAVRRPGRRRWAVLAGVLATMPLLAVQSYADGLVFAGVLLLVSVVAGLLPLRDALRVALGGLLGVLLVAGALVVTVAATSITASQLWFQTMGYRVEASRVISTGDGAMPAERLTTLVTLAAMSGVLVLIAGLVLGVRELARPEHRRLLPVWCAVVAMLVLTLGSMVAGGDYWPDYMLQAIPALAMAAALVAPSPRGRGAAMRVGAAMAVVGAVLAIWLGHERPRLGTPVNEAVVGEWLAENRQPADTAVVLFGKANVLHHAEMTSPYPFLWSLLVRTLDPDLDELRTALEGDRAPTWVVQWHELDTWGLDADGRVGEVLERRYVHVGRPCGQDVYLLRTAVRPLSEPGRCPTFR